LGEFEGDNFNWMAPKALHDV